MTFLVIKECRISNMKDDVGRKPAAVLVYYAKPDLIYRSDSLKWIEIQKMKESLCGSEVIDYLENLVPFQLN